MIVATCSAGSLHHFGVEHTAKQLTVSKSAGALGRSAPLGPHRPSSLMTAATFNLRDFSKKRGKGLSSDERPDSGGASKRAPYEQIDLIGGNGHWRQVKAEKDFERRRIEDENQRREQVKQEAERSRRKQMKEDRIRRQVEEEERKRFEAQEKKRATQEEKERLEFERQERERLRKEADHADWLRRQPVTCETCAGEASCQVCEGKGHVYGIYLVSTVVHSTAPPEKDFGKLVQGCTNCCGLVHGVRGDLQKGSGKCPPCGGTGKIWPIFESPKHRKVEASFSTAHFPSFGSP